MALYHRHHRTGRQWKTYSTYDFCAPILDSLEGVTVALRTNEYHDRNVQYEWMQEALALRKVTIWDFSVRNTGKINVSLNNSGNRAISLSVSIMVCMKTVMVG
jgi:glutamyl/glutaminyl-tRNA synthetase